MSCLDLTAAVEAAATRAYAAHIEAARAADRGSWDARDAVDADAEWKATTHGTRHSWREHVLPIVIAASPAIAHAAIPAPTPEAVERIWSEINNGSIAVASVAAVLRHLRTNAGRIQ